LRQAAKALSRRPQSFADCIQRARQVFDSHYRRKALSLLHTYPADTKSDDKGTLFWAAPKSAYVPITFDWRDPLHRQYVVHYAALLAKVWEISLNDERWHTNDCQVAEALCAASPPSSSNVATNTSATNSTLAADALASLDSLYAQQIGLAPIQEFVPKKKVIVTDESLSKEAALKKEQDNDDFDAQLSRWVATFAIV
jgi:hypothetical protein